MVRIRLKRTGTRNRSCFRVVVMDQRSTRDGRSIEEIGFYDPLNNEERLKMDRYEHWLGRGAQPSKTVADIARRIKDGVSTKPAVEEKTETVEETVTQSEESAEKIETPAAEVEEKPDTTEKADSSENSDAEKDSE